MLLKLLQPDLKSFLIAYKAATEPTGIAARRLWRNEIIFELKIIKRKINLSYIGVVNQPQKGFGSAAMQWLINLADDHQVFLTGTAEPIGDQAMTINKLKSFYEKFGFQMHLDDRMERSPSQQILKQTA